MAHTPDSICLITHPYRHMTEVNGRADLIRAAGRVPGSALVWQMRNPESRQPHPLVAGRPGGLSLIVVLPDVEQVMGDPIVIEVVNMVRPHGILPFHIQPVAKDMAQVLRRPPIDLAAEVTDYLDWRGLTIERDTKQLVRHILDHSNELRSITALARSLYMSRRALGRRLLNHGLPVPSHWLQLGRLLRLASRLQNSDESIFTIACDAGYPDGFSLSNQMHRLLGFRPSEVRERLGWEWLLEEWLRREADAGGLAPRFATHMASGTRPDRHGARPAPQKTSA